VRAYTLKDDGATHNFISTRFVNQHHIPKYDTGCTVQIICAQDNELDVPSRPQQQVELLIELRDKNDKPFRFTDTFQVVPLGRYDMIFGKPWHERFRPLVNYCQNRCVVEHEQQRYYLHGLPRNIHPAPQHLNLLSLQQTRKALRQGDECIICLVRQNDNYREEGSVHTDE